jgi:thiol-disulfide isomerase/thioredoxin
MDISRFLEEEIDMDLLHNPINMSQFATEIQDVYSGENKLLLVLIHTPKCGFCRGYYAEFNKICEKLPGLCKGVAIDFDELDEDSIYSRETETVPRVFSILSNGDGTIKSTDYDEHERSYDSILPILAELAGSEASPEPPITITPKKTGPKKKQTKKKNQKGKGIMESAIATAILGGTAHNSKTVQKYVSQVESGLLGLSKVSKDIAQGTIKVISEQDFMKKLLPRKNKNKSTRKKKRVNQKKRKNTRKR